MHAALLGDSDPGIVGGWRTQQVWIGGGDYSPHDAAFVPPHHDRVPAAMDDLIVFLGREDVEPLAQAAVAHAPFDTIHPFPDGSGRVGRAMVHSLMRSKRITRNVTIPVSAGLLTNLDSYFDALTEYRLGRPEPIVRLMAEASFSSIANGRTLVSDLRSVRRVAAGTVTNPGPVRRSSMESRRHLDGATRHRLASGPGAPWHPGHVRQPGHPTPGKGPGPQGGYRQVPGSGLRGQRGPCCTRRLCRPGRPPG